MTRPHYNTGGFTLVELIVTMAIGAIILTQAVPSFLYTIKSNRLTTETNKLVADINLARSEAINRSGNIVVCSSANPSASSPSCASSTTWSTGWLVFADDGDGSFDASNDTLIRIGLGQASNSTISFISTDNAVIYTSEGLTTSTSTIVIAICDDRGTDSGRQIQVNPTGRPRLITGDSTDPIPSCTAPAAA
jgi:type IV fimbrial biogenesis protein FimT